MADGLAASECKSLHLCSILAELGPSLSPLPVFHFIPHTSPLPLPLTPTTHPYHSPLPLIPPLTPTTHPYHSLLPLTPTPHPTPGGPPPLPLLSFHPIPLLLYPSLPLHPSHFPTPTRYPTHPFPLSPLIPCTHPSCSPSATNDWRRTYECSSSIACTTSTSRRTRSSPPSPTPPPTHGSTPEWDTNWSSFWPRMKRWEGGAACGWGRWGVVYMKSVL